MVSHERQPHSSVPARIAFCITELEPGGAERCLVELVTRLDRRRFAPVVYCLGPRPAGNPTSLADRLEAAGIVVHCFGARRRIGLPRLLLQLRRQITSDAPRIVQAFLFHANAAGTIAARWAGIRHVVTGIRVAEHGARWHVSMSACLDRWVERHVCVSQSVRDFSARHGLRAEKLVVIPNGVDVERLASAAALPLSDLGLAADRKLVTFVGRLERQKGLDRLLSACGPLLSAFPQHDLLVIGDGPRRRALEEQVHQLGLAGRVHFAGFRDDVPEVLAASELVVVPSLWEGMSNVVLEAMAAGRPVVATAFEGIAEQLGPHAEAQVAGGLDGDRHENGRHDLHLKDFVAKAIAILGDPALARSLGEANRKRAGEHFSFSAMVYAYERLYAALLAASEVPSSPEASPTTF